MRRLDKVKLVVGGLFLAGFFLFLFTANPENQTAAAHSAGPPAGHTAAPGEKNCSECHTPTVPSQGRFTINAPATYVPGQTYQITVKHTSTDPTRRRWGFQMTVLDSGNVPAGKLQSADGFTQIAPDPGPFPDRQYIEHTQVGTFAGQQNLASWTFNWTAPSSDVGPITFFAAGNQANNDGNTSGDSILTTFVGSRAAVPSPTPTPSPSPTPNPDFSVAASPVSNIAVPQGSGISYSVSVTPTAGFTGAVNLSPGALPPGVTASFNPISVQISDTSPKTSVLSVTAAAGTTPGTYTLTINASGASVQHATTTLVTVYSPASNPLDDATFFVRQHYLDFLNREPDPAGFQYWTERITGNASNSPAPCAQWDAACINSRRIGVSAAFFIELEFQETGYYVYRLYKASLGRQPRFGEFMTDRSGLHAGPTLDSDKQKLATLFVARSEFLTIYPATMTANSFVSTLLDSVKKSSGVDLTAQQASLTALYDGTDAGRVNIITQVINDTAYMQKEYNPSFVMMQYFGYLRRDYDQGGYDFWLGILNNKLPNDSSGYDAMVCAFITSDEYQKRFAVTSTHANTECK